MTSMMTEGLSIKTLDQWRPWRLATTEDGRGSVGDWLPHYGPSTFPRPRTKDAHAFTGATYTNASKQVELAGAFANYGCCDGDELVITACSESSYLGSHKIASRTSALIIVLTTALGGDATGVGGYIKQAPRVVVVHPHSALLLRMFGTDGENETSKMRLTGWMNPRESHGVGKPFRLWDGTIRLGSDTIDEAPLADAGMTEQKWYEVDYYDESAGSNDCGAIKIGGEGSNRPSMLLVPTLGYHSILMELIDFGVGATEMASVAALWRPCLVHMQP